MRIGVWNTAFLGDAVLTLPLLQSLRAAYPEAAIHFWVRKGLGALFAAHPAVTDVFEYDKHGRDSGLLQTLRRGRELAAQAYDIWIAAHSSLRSALLARACGARVRIGYEFPRLGRWCFTHRAPRRFHELEEIERLLQLLGPLDIQETPHWPQIVLPQDARERAQELLGRKERPRCGRHEGTPLLGLHPGSVWGTKRWPAPYFAEIGARALAAGARVVLFAGPGEEAVAGEVREGILAKAGLSKAGRAEEKSAGERLLDLSGALSLPVLAACLGLPDCYLTNDSGPMHLAWPQETPVVALFGPTVKELGFFPRGETSKVMETPLPCRPCGLHGPQECPLGHHDCMRRITPDQVWPQVEKYLFG